jgi:hypothetical protein
MLLNKPFSAGVLSQKLQEAKQNADASSGNSFTARNSG